MRWSAAFALVLAALVGLSACGSSSEGAASEVPTGPLVVVGGGAAPYKHHDVVSTWGSEASKAELAKAARAEHAYLVARAEGDWTEACRQISETLEQRLTARSERFAQQGCAKTFASIAEPIPAESAYAATEVEADSLRSDGVWAFLLYRAAGSRYFMPMVTDAGGWKVNLVEPRPFVKPATAGRG